MMMTTTTPMYDTLVEEYDALRGVDIPAMLTRESWSLEAANAQISEAMDQHRDRIARQTAQAERGKMKARNQRDPNSGKSSRK